MKRFFCLCLALLLLLPTLAACTGDSGADAAEDTATDTTVADTTDGTAAPETTPPPKELTMEPKKTIPIIRDGKTDYTLIIEPETLSALSADIAYMNRVMDEKFGTHPEAAEVTTGPAICLSCAEGPGLDWSIEVNDTNSHIDILASSPAALSRAIQYFVTQYLSGPAGDLYVDVAADYRYSYATDKINNASLLTYKGGDGTTLSPSDAEGRLKTPDWLDTAIMVELRVDIADIGGSFPESYDLVDFYAETGVNVLWLSPVYDRGDPDYGYVGNGYGNWGVNTIEPSLTGTSRDNYDEGWAVLKQFVDYAHSKGIYVLLDIITWGTNGCPLADDHPELFDGLAAWGGPAYAWKRPEFVDWFVDVAVDNLEKTGADGYRCDCEPFTAGYAVFEKIRTEANARGLYPVLMSEEGGRRDASFDCEQDGVLKYAAMSRGQLYQDPTNFFVDGHLNMITTIKRGIGLGGPEQQKDRKTMGTYRYYTNCITNHDYQARNVNGNRLKIGYAAIYAPFIPVWFMGDEMGQTLDGKGVLYFQPVTYGVIGEDASRTYFYEDVKQMIAIRRTYPELFGEWPLNHRDSNICEVEVEGLSKLPNYARYTEDKAVLVVANNEEGNDGLCRVKIPFAMFGETDAGQNYRVTDLLTGRVITVGFAETVDNFNAIVPYEYCGVFLVEKIP